MVATAVATKEPYEIVTLVSTGLEAGLATKEAAEIVTQVSTGVATGLTEIVTGAVGGVSTGIVMLWEGYKLVTSVKDLLGDNSTDGFEKMRKKTDEFQIKMNEMKETS